MAIIYGSARNDYLVDDYLTNTITDDILYGGFGDDTLISHSGTDTLDGGEGSDRLIIIRGVAAGGNGTDTLIANYQSANFTTGSITGGIHLGHLSQCNIKRRDTGLPVLSFNGIEIFEVIETQYAQIPLVTKRSKWESIRFLLPMALMLLILWVLNTMICLKAMT